MSAGALDRAWSCTKQQDCGTARWLITASSGNAKTRAGLNRAQNEPKMKQPSSPSIYSSLVCSLMTRPAKMQTSALRVLFVACLIIVAHDLSFSDNQNGQTRFLALARASAQMPILSSIYLQSSAGGDSSSSLQRTVAVPISQQAAHIKRDLSSNDKQHHQSNESVCQVRDGESVAIVEIEESRGSDTSQWTNPSVLPISGSVELGEIELRIESETHKYFKIENKSLRLTRALDRDAVLRDNSTQIAQPAISSIYLQISCTDKRASGAESAPTRSSSGHRQRKVIIPVLVKVLDLNDNAPKFSSPVYTAEVDELAPVGSVVLDSIQALDLDSAANGQIEYSLLGAPARDDSDSPSATKGRLVQRVAPQAPATSATSSAAVATTTTASAALVASSKAGSAPATTATQASAAVTTLRPPTTTLSSAAESSADGQPARRKKNEPTINLSSELIVNGPMDEGDEEESDEEMLASMEAPSTSRQGATSPPATRDDSDDNTGNDDDDDDSLLARKPAQSARDSQHQHQRRRRRRRKRSQRAKQQDSGALPWTNLLAAGAQPAQAELLSETTRSPAADSAASSEFFALELSPQTGRPVIRLRRALDYESQRTHTLKVMASDRAKGERLSSVATVIVRVLDGDDQPPVFVLDQQGCATSSIVQTTTPSSGRVGTESASSSGPTTTTTTPTATSTTTSSTPHRRRPGAADEDADTNEHVSEFWDTLGLDDNPLDIEPVSGQASRSGARARSAPAARADYQCLQSAAGQQHGQAEYYASVMSGDTDYVLRVAPQAVRARDRDELNAPIRYSFINGTPANYSSYFQINALDASIKQVQPVEQTQVGEFEIWIQAQELSQRGLASVAKLTIGVVPSDKSPPVLVPNSYAGQIEENAPLGARVLVAAPAPSSGAEHVFMQIRVLDSDHQPAPQQPQRSTGAESGPGRRLPSYDFETTSDAFRVDSSGFVHVNRAGLDRDEPHQAVHMFQVTARQVGLTSSRSISSPVSLNVTLLDQNDNPPVLLNATLLPVRLAANSRGGSQLVTRIRAQDKDLPGANSRAHFSLRHVSNNGADRFRIDDESGEISALGKFFAGEQFSLTVQVADELQRQAQGIVDVLVVPGANSAGPQFVIDGNERDNSRGYSIEVNEAAAVHSAVLQVRAVDPENDQITYSLVSAGLQDGHVGQLDFSINSKTGLLSVANKLDREEISAYNLLVQARDSAGLATTRPIQITITDCNDNNPTFGQPSYVFSVDEGASGVRLGSVHASDSDAGENGRITYSLLELGAPSSAQHAKVFAIDEHSGELSLLAGQPLDYETKRVHELLVSARDNGETPRSSSASVQVRVLDAQDEAPYFERPYLSAEIDENLAPGQRVAQVSARDPDSAPQIVYLLLAGDSSLFAVDAQTGVVSTLQALDCELARAHTILVGTNESLAAPDFDLVAASNALNEAIAREASAQIERSPIARIDVRVRDLNDNAPLFEWPEPAGLLPLRVQDSAQVGAKLVQLRARDRDASVPNNQVRYELVRAEPGAEQQQRPGEQQATSERCARLFLVDPSSGQVSLSSELRREPHLSECQLVVRAHDLPANERQQLSSLASVTVLIDHLADISPATMIGFADSSFTVELAENARANTLVKLLPVINKPKSGTANFPMSCEIVSGNELAKFYAKESDSNDCELRTRDASLDYEKQQRYKLTVRLNTIGTSARSSLLAQVQVNIIDQNDNGPVFVPVTRYGQLTQRRYLAAVALDAPSDTQVIQLRATDADLSHPNNLISYELLGASGATAAAAPATVAESTSGGSDQTDSGPATRDLIGDKFKIDPLAGIVRTSQSVEDIPPSRLPLRLRVMARDNPVEIGSTLESSAEVVLNLIDERHRVALTLRDTPMSRVLDAREQLLGIVQERSGLIPGLERIESLKVQRNASLIEADVSGTDVWLYLIEPGTLRIVPSDDSRVRATMFDSRAQNSLADVINQSLGFAKVKVRLPYALTGAGGSGLAAYALRDVPTSLLGSLIRGHTANDRLAPVLIIIALFIGLFTAIVVIYQCGSLASLSLSTNSTLAKQPVFGPFMQQPNKLDQYFFANIQRSPTESQFSTGDKMVAGHALSQCDPYCHSALANYQTQQQQQQSLTKFSAGVPTSNPLAASQEYETQMLKMSVLFDENHSCDEQSLQEQALVKQSFVP